MRKSGKAQFVTERQRSATYSSENGRRWLTFLRLYGQILDGHERSMAGTDCPPSCGPGDHRGA